MSGGSRVTILSVVLVALACQGAETATLIDRATFAEPMKPAVGISHVLVNGTFVVRNGDLIADARPGRPIRTGGASTDGR